MTRIRKQRAMWAAAAAICASYILSTLPTPLYPIYQSQFHFSALMLTVIYAIYVVGTVCAMFFFGRLSDQIGRRPVVLISLAIAIVAAIVFLVAQDTWWLFAARILSGLAIALVSGAATAWILELEPRHDSAAATQFAIAANFLGLGLGPLLAGILAQYAAWPLRLSYGVFIVLVMPVALVVWKAEDSLKQTKSLGEANIWPRFGVPKEIVGSFVPAAVAAFATFAVLGFYAALIPTVLQKTLQDSNHATAGVVVAELFFVGTIMIAATPRLRSHGGLLLALALLLPALALLITAELIHSMIVLLIGTAISGVATGTGYRCSLQKVNEIAPKNQRAEMVSTYLIACYAGISLPVVGIGLSANAVSPTMADTIFAVIIGVLTGAALIVEMANGQVSRGVPAMS